MPGSLSSGQHKDSAILSTSGEMIAFLEAERRFGDSWVVEVEARRLLNTDEPAPLHGLRRDDFVTLGLTRYFWAGRVRQALPASAHEPATLASG